MEITGVVKSVTLSTEIEKRAGGTYRGWQLITEVDGEEKTFQGHEISLKKTNGLKEALAALNPLDLVTVFQSKNGAFWNVDEVRKGGGTNGASGGAVASPSRSYGRSEDTNRSIIRQTCLKAAAEYCSNKDRSPEDVIVTAEAFETWVTR